MIDPDTPFRPLTQEQAHCLIALHRDLEQINTHGPDAAGLNERIEARRARLAELGIARSDQP
ncbi:hypothetical protein [Deinococcus apachensis]|uniref:hypothetical protein n=1 Tax=Deinococcus apachensis TaxID=309886 RepID=UPI00037E3185|nr:hypothetical protein [Deinococcus apachensis]